LLSSAGVPQIVLPCWFDTFDFAQRVEYHGIGIYGSRSVAPEVDAEELGKALVTITDPKNEKGKEIVLRAKELGQVLKKYGGRKTAAEKILELAEHADFRRRDVA
jgi:UDP:flavonoid glycosyltransferase YjiC (YdhE family)